MHGIVVFVAKYFIVLSALVALWIFVTLPRKQKKEFILVGVGGAVIALVLAKVGNHLYYDPRPFVEGHFTPYFGHGNDNGFPSDHTLLAGWLAFLGLRYSKKLGWLLIALALLVGLARVKAGVHHLLDILGSLVFSGIGVWLAGLVAGKIGTTPTYIAKKHHN